MEFEIFNLVFLECPKDNKVVRVALGEHETWHTTSSLHVNEIFLRELAYVIDVHTLYTLRLNYLWAIWLNEYNNVSIMCDEDVTHGCRRLLHRQVMMKVNTL